MHILKLGVAIMALTASLCVSASIAAPQNGMMKDPRDEKTYKTVKIGDQVWMAENLALEITEINGNPGSTNECWILGGNGKKANCKKYGQYYSALAASVACPDGWHLPSAPEFKKMLDYAGNSIDLKSKEGWNTYQQSSGNGIDKYGFNAQPSGGCIVAKDGECSYLEEGKRAYFWTSTVPSDTEGVAYAFLGASHTDYGFDLAPQSKGLWMFFPVRCIQNEKKNVGDVSADFNEGEATESSSHDACKAAVAKAKNTFNRCKTFPKESSERSLCAKKYKKEKENAEKACIIKNAKNSCSRSASDIMKVVRQRTPGLRQVYNKALKNKRNFQGIVKIKFSINSDGNVVKTSVESSTTGNDVFDNEISTAVKLWNFGKHKCDDGNVANVTTVTIPFTFSE